MNKTTMGIFAAMLFVFAAASVSAEETRPTFCYGDYDMRVCQFSDLCRGDVIPTFCDGLIDVRSCAKAAVCEPLPPPADYPTVEWTVQKEYLTSSTAYVMVRRAVWQSEDDFGNWLAYRSGNRAWYRVPIADYNPLGETPLSRYGLEADFIIWDGLITRDWR